MIISKQRIKSLDNCIIYMYSYICISLSLSLYIYRRPLAGVETKDVYVCMRASVCDFLKCFAGHLMPICSYALIPPCPYARGGRGWGTYTDHFRFSPHPTYLVIWLASLTYKFCCPYSHKPQATSHKPHATSTTNMLICPIWSYALYATYKLKNLKKS